MGAPGGCGGAPVGCVGGTGSRGGPPGRGGSRQSSQEREPGAGWRRSAAAGGVRRGGGLGRRRSLPSFAGLEPPLGSAPSSSPLGSAGSEPLLPFPLAGAGSVSCRAPAAPTPLGPIHPGPARPRDARVRPGAAGRGVAESCGRFPASGDGRERGGGGQPAAGGPAVWRLEALGSGGVPAGGAGRGWGCGWLVRGKGRVVKTVTPPTSPSGSV